MNLRKDKGRKDKGWKDKGCWYGTLTILWDAKGQRPFFTFTPVQADRTVESMAE